MRPDVFLSLGRILTAIGDPPNPHREPIPGDLDLIASFYFDGGACVEITGGGWDYTFADGTTARVSVGFPFESGGPRATVHLPGQGTWTIASSPAPQAQSQERSLFCCVCGGAIRARDTQQITAAGPAHAVCPPP